MRIITAGSLRIRAVGGADREGRGDGPAIVLCHGFGAPGDDLVSLARVIDAGPGARFFFPEAPLSLDMGFGMTGRAWWMIDMARLQQMAMGRGGARSFPVDEVPEGLASASKQLDEAIDALVASEGLDPARTIVGGFSQGAMITSHISITGARSFAGLVVMSGALIAAEQWKTALATSGKGLDVVQSHGRHDPLLPFPVAEQLRALLTEHGARVDFIAHNGQHEIPMPVIDRVSAFAQRKFST